LDYEKLRSKKNMKERIAVIGAGISGIVSSYLLQEIADVTLFEAEERLGGHTNTVTIRHGIDQGTAVDTGFIVLNTKNYPLFHAFLKKLNVPVRMSDMSFSFYSEEESVGYAGRTLSSLFAQPRDLFRRRHWRMLFEIIRFCKEGVLYLQTTSHNPEFHGETLGEYLRRNRYHAEAIDWYILPMAAAIWSAPKNEILDFPAQSFLSFFSNHGLLSIKDRPQWQTVVGGSHSYLKAFQNQFRGSIRTMSRVRKVERLSEGVSLSGLFDGQEVQNEHFDRVIFAIHADQILQILENPTEEEKQVFQQWKYSTNQVILHTDENFMPQNRKIWSSWNYIADKNDRGDRPVSVTYWMNLLQGLKTSKEYFVTLNAPKEIKIDSTKIIQTITYQHPIFSSDAVFSQKNIPRLQGMQKTYFCGAYCGYGFHEDGTRSAVNVVREIAKGFDRTDASIWLE
jgi:uncharacterized protein